MKRRALEAAYSQVVSRDVPAWAYDKGKSHITVAITVVRRYEKGAMIITTNRPMEDWGQVLGDTATAAAILDRLLHHNEVIRLQGRSYRMHNRRELRNTQARQTLTGQTE